MWVSEKVGATSYLRNYCTKKKLLRNYDSLQVGCSLPRCKNGKYRLVYEELFLKKKKKEKKMKERYIQEQKL